MKTLSDATLIKRQRLEIIFMGFLYVVSMLMVQSFMISQTDSLQSSISGNETSNKLAQYLVDFVGSYGTPGLVGIVLVLSILLMVVSFAPPLLCIYLPLFLRKYKESILEETKNNKKIIWKALKVGVIISVLSLIGTGIYIFVNTDPTALVYTSILLDLAVATFASIVVFQMLSKLYKDQ